MTLLAVSENLFMNTIRKRLLVCIFLYWCWNLLFTICLLQWTLVNGHCCM